MKFVNLTPHDVHIHTPNGAVITIERSGIIARVATSSVEVSCEGGVRFRRTTLGETIGLPEQVKGTIYIASRMFAAAVRRADVVSPDEPVRDEAGQIIGCLALELHA